jgi:beta-lactam-binding protein with PASTA domain
LGHWIFKRELNMKKHILIILGLAVGLILAALALAQGPTVKVPNIVGMEVGLAQKELERAGLRMWQRLEGEKPSPGFKAVYKIVRQNPPPGKPVARQTLVEAFIRAEIIKARVPQVVGLHVDNARRRLAEEGFQVRIQFLEKYNPMKDGVVFTQDPQPDTLLALGGLIRLIAYPSKANQASQAFPQSENIPGYGVLEGKVSQPKLDGTDGSAAPKLTPQKK